MRSQWILCLTFIALFAGGIACSASSAADKANGPVIASLTAEHTTLYPLGNTRVECVATSVDSSQLKYKWTSSDGKIIGTGAQITWEAPKTYGDFHILATVDDGQGHSASKYVTVTVIVRDGSTCCR